MSLPSAQELERLRAAKVHGQRGIKCGDCGAWMKLKLGKYGRFYGCSKYPECRGTLDADDLTGAPNGIPADKNTRHHRHQLIVATEAAMKRGVYDRDEVCRAINNRMFWEGRGIGILSKEECVRAINVICKRDPSIREIVDDVGKPPLSAWEILLTSDEL